MIGFKFKNAPRLNTEELSIGSKHTPFLIRLNDINHPNPNYGDLICFHYSLILCYLKIIVI